MTDQDKIKKLVEWMGEGTPEDHDPRIMQGTDGRYYIDTVVCACSKDAEPEYRVRIWNPLTNIADAWMLMQHFDANGVSGQDLFYDWWQERDELGMLPASEAARAICKAILWVIK